MTHYSKEVPGERVNHGWAVRFDKSRGCVGIDQYDEGGKVTDRVLLSPKQVAAFRKFVTAPLRRRKVAK